MKAIGGYFELADYGRGAFPHPNGLLLNTGRNALETILRQLGNIRSVYLPYYTCEAVFEPIDKLHIPRKFYTVNSLFELAEDIELFEDEYLIVNNYFGIKDAYIRSLIPKYGDHLIVDCAQALFYATPPGIKAFYSFRKFVGVADGGVAYTGLRPDDSAFPVDDTSSHDSHLYIRRESGAEAGFADYQRNEHLLENQPIRSMSAKTRDILAHIDYSNVIQRRRENWRFLHVHLKGRNQLNLPDIDSFVCPMVYPFLGDSDLRAKMHRNKIYVASYWPNVTDFDGYPEECMLADRIIPLPIDQRYSSCEMEQILSVL